MVDLILRKLSVEELELAKQPGEIVVSDRKCPNCGWDMDKNKGFNHEFSPFNYPENRCKTWKQEESNE